MTIHLYKPTVEISIEGSVTSQEKVNALESLMAIITNRGLVSLNVQDIETVAAGMPCKLFIKYNKSIDQILDSFSSKHELCSLKRILVYAWASENILRQAHALNGFAKQCASEGCLVKWGFGIDKTLEQTKLFVLYSNSTGEFVDDKKDFYVEEYLDYRQLTLPLGIKARFKKGSGEGDLSILHVNS